MADLEILLDGRAFLEGPRWHVEPDGRGALYTSDMHAHEVLRVDEDGAVDVVAALPASPSGLGWLPDGDLLVVVMEDRVVLRRDADGAMHQHADCTGLAPNEINDMVVDDAGHAFVSQFGFDFHGGAAFASAPVLRIDPDGAVHAATDGLRMANGMVITADGSTLVVAQSAGKDLVAFDLAPDGSLTGRRVWADLPEYPDGICIDAEDAVWIASPVGDCFVRLGEGGAVLDRVDVPGRHAIACAIGGSDGHTLFCCTSPTHGQPDESRTARGAKVETVRVEVPAPA